MKLTPLDLSQHQFRTSLRGYDPREVDRLLDDVREEWEALMRDNQALRDELAKLEKKLREYQGTEKTLQETLVTAQKLTEDMKQSARKEAEIVLSQAELQADKIIHQAHGRLMQIIDEINDLKRQRAEFEGKLKSLIETHQRLLELQKEGRETLSQIENVTLLPKSI